MSEDYRIISQPRAEPRPAGSVGVCVRFQLSGCPSREWSGDLGARLATELVGHASVGHLRIDVKDIVQGDQIVLEGVEASAAPTLAHALRRAVDAANDAHRHDVDPSANMTHSEADAIASEVAVNDPVREVVPDATDQPRCPRCAQPVPLTITDVKAGDQLAVGRRECPNCGTPLVRNVDGHADRGWRVAETGAD
jgi:endogenous inhibitor of DNA gyrase (YacG/DUF329 family)